MVGDANGDARVDVSDLGILAANYGQSGRVWEQGDFNGDGRVDVSDLGILASAYGQGTGRAVDGQSLEFESNPEIMPSGECFGPGLVLIMILLEGILLITYSGAQSFNKWRNQNE